MNNSTKTTEEQALERYESAMIDADIEGLARDLEAEALIEKWRAEGVDIETQIERMKDRYRARALRATE